MKLKPTNILILKIFSIFKAKSKLKKIFCYNLKGSKEHVTDEIHMQKKDH